MQQTRPLKLLWTSFLLSSAFVLDPWQFQISQKRYPSRNNTMTIPYHDIKTETVELIAWIKVKTPSFRIDSEEYGEKDDLTISDKHDEKDDCLPASIEKETDKEGSIHFKASHPNLQNQLQTFAVDMNQNSEIPIYLCLSNLTPDSHRGIQFEATVDKPVCRDVTVTLKIGSPRCRNTHEIEEGAPPLKQTNKQSDSTKIENIKTTAIIFLSIIVLIFIIKWGWKRMSAKCAGSQRVQDANSENSGNIESGGCLAEFIPKAMGRNRGKKAKKDN